MSEEEVEEEGDDDIPYNPKNLPLGWDGKLNINHLSHLIVQRKLMIVGPIGCRPYNCFSPPPSSSPSPSPPPSVTKQIDHNIINIFMI